MTPIKKSILAIVGPTASGKTEVAFDISKRLPVEIISCDSMQVYRCMPIVTQAPPKKITRKVKTHLVNFLSPTKEFNAALFRSMAVAKLETIHKKGKTPLLVGGTGLYFRALFDGLFEAEDGGALKDENLRSQLQADEKRHGPGYLHRELVKVDALAAKRIHPNDTRRLVRALEVYHLSGKPMSEQQPKRSGIRDSYHYRVFLLDRERGDLYDRINRRVDMMIHEGLVKEVRGLRKKKLSLTAQSALGIKEISAYLAGACDLPKALETLKKNTRNYAKRQLSWFRHEKGVEVLPVAVHDSPGVLARQILTLWKELHL